MYKPIKLLHLLKYVSEMLNLLNHHEPPSSIFPGSRKRVVKTGILFKEESNKNHTKQESMVTVTKEAGPTFFVSRWLTSRVKATIVVSPLSFKRSQEKYVVVIVEIISTHELE